MTSPVDHLVFATKNVTDGIAQIEELLGLPAVSGGSHPGLGTCNALVALGTQCYLEIIGPDPEQPDFQGTRPFGIDGLEASKLMSWCARRERLSNFIQSVRAEDVDLSNVIPMSRVTPQGETLNWELSFLTQSEPDQAAVLPFFIAWGKTPHPSSQCVESGQLLKLELQHPTPEKVSRSVEILELEVSVCEGIQPGLRAYIQCPRGEVELV